MKAPLFPNTALGPVTLDGQIVSEGAVLNKNGTLLVDCGGFSVDSVRVFNGDTEWAPQSVSGRVQQYNVSSDGNFTVRTSEGRVLLSFSVTIPQDFKIVKTYKFNSSSTLTPGDVTSVGTYRQVDDSAGLNDYWVWVQADDVDISSLALRTTNGATASKASKNPQYGNSWLKLNCDISEVAAGYSVSLFVGNVLVLYIANVTK